LVVVRGFFDTYPTFRPGNVLPRRREPTAASSIQMATSRGAA
jgi:hypothetical protein